MDNKKIEQPAAPNSNNERTGKEERLVETLIIPEERKSEGEGMNEMLRIMLKDVEDKIEEIKKLETELGPEHDDVIALKVELEFLQEVIEQDQEGLELFIEDIKDLEEAITVTPVEIAVQNRAARIEAIRTELENINNDALAETLTKELNELDDDQRQARSKDGKSRDR